MSNNKFTHNLSMEIISTSNKDERISVEESTLDYGVSEGVDKNQTSAIIVNHKFFISHASRSAKAEPGERPPLPYEKEFVTLLVDRLEEGYPNSTYVDYRDNPFYDFDIFHNALKTSEYGIFVCSPRFKDRYLNESSAFIMKEVQQFWEYKNIHHQPRRQIPIKFGLKDLEYTNGPFLLSDFVIDVEYETLSIEDMVERVMLSIVRIV